MWQQSCIVHQDLITIGCCHLIYQRVFKISFPLFTRFSQSTSLCEQSFLLKKDFKTHLFLFSQLCCQNCWGKKLKKGILMVFGQMSSLVNGFQHTILLCVIEFNRGPLLQHLLIKSLCVLQELCTCFDVSIHLTRILIVNTHFLTAIYCLSRPNN